MSNGSFSISNTANTWFETPKVFNIFEDTESFENTFCQMYVIKAIKYGYDQESN